MMWTTITSFVDKETGEVLTARHIEGGHYVKVKCNTMYKKQNEDYGYKYNNWECERNRQTSLELRINYSK